MNIFVVAISIICISLLISEFYTIWRKLNMHTTDRKLSERGIIPYGSGVCHGMVLSKDKKGVIKDQKKTPAWYSRLD